MILDLLEAKWILFIGAVWRVEDRGDTMRFHTTWKHFDMSRERYLRLGLDHPMRRTTAPRGAVAPRYGL